MNISLFTIAYYDEAAILCFTTDKKLNNSEAKSAATFNQTLIQIPELASTEVLVSALLRDAFTRQFMFLKPLLWLPETLAKGDDRAFT